MTMRSLTALAASTAAALAASLASPAAAGTPEPYTSVLVADDLSFPVGAFSAPGDFTRLYVLEKRGVIRVLNTKTGQVNATPFLDIDALVTGGTSTNDERGLLGLAFHPDWQNNRTFFVNYTGSAGATTVRRYVANDGDTANAASGTTILTISQPFSNHNAGWMGFSPNDGYLYIATGDGGSGGDPGNRAQDITNQLLGKMLRIDVDGAAPYEIPKSNPFVGSTGDDEIWHYGLRNPWRCAFDRETGDLYIADVGQNAREEVNFQRSISAGGLNYGWRCREGRSNFNFSGNCGLLTLTEPKVDYTHALGFSLTGGYNYRGCAIDGLENTYFMADYGSNRIWTIPGGQVSVPTNGMTDVTADLVPQGGGFISRISSFGEDQRGELYIVDQGSGNSGEVFKIIPVTANNAAFDFDCDGSVGFSDLLAQLSEWGPCDGCLTDVNGDHQVNFDDLLQLLAAFD